MALIRDDARDRRASWARCPTNAPAVPLQRDLEAHAEDDFA